MQHWLDDRARLLVKQVDALYLSGMSDYRAGNLEEAKQKAAKLTGKG